MLNELKIKISRPCKNMLVRFDEMLKHIYPVHQQVGYVLLGHIPRESVSNLRLILGLYIFPATEFALNFRAINLLESLHRTDRD
jgi:hypothetical protein